MKKKLISLIIVSLATLLVACGAPNSAENSTGAKKVDNGQTKKVEKESKEEPANNETFSVGDSVEVSGEVYTLNSVELTEERNEYAETDPSYVVVVKWTVENKTDEDIFAGAGIGFYDASKTKAEGYALDFKQDNIAPGMKFEAEAAFGISELGEYEIHLNPFVDLDGKRAIFKGTLE